MNSENEILIKLGISGTESETELLGKLKVALTETTNAMNALIKTQAGRAFKSQEELKAIGDEIQAQTQLKKSISDLINAKENEAKAAAKVEKAAESERQNILKTAAAYDAAFAKKVEKANREATLLSEKLAGNKVEADSIIGMRQQLSLLEQAYLRMGKAERESAAGKALETSLISQQQAVTALEQKMGNFRRNVGNYASGWNGLSNSINQVTRELPNFAQSWTIGFMALSNNLPILQEELGKVIKLNKQLIADGKAVEPVWKQIGKSLFSPQSALITLISLSVIYSKEIAAMFSGVKVLTEEEKKLIEEQKKLNESIADTNLLWDKHNGKLTEAEYALHKIALEYGKSISQISKNTKKEIESIEGNWEGFKRFMATLFSSDDMASEYLKSDKLLESFKKDQKSRKDAEAKLNDELSKLAVKNADNLKKELENSKKGELDKNYQLEIESINKKRELAYQSEGMATKDKEEYRTQARLIDKIYKQELFNAEKKHNEEVAKAKKEADDKALKAKEDYQKELYTLTEKYHDAQIANTENNQLKALESENENYHRLVDLYKKDAKDSEAIAKLKHDILEEEERTHIRNIAKIMLDPKYLEEENKVKGTGITGLIGTRPTGKTKEEKKQDEEDLKNRKLAKDAAINAAKQTVDAIAQIKQNALDRDLKRELTAIQRNADKEDRILENRLKNGIISEGQYNDAKQKLNEETAAKELEANRAMFEKKKKLDTATAIANGALAITSILAQYPKFDYGIAAAIAIGAAVATTATQVAVIQSQKFALGGKVDGNSHAEGGVMIEAEGGEGMINKNSMRSSQVMSVIGTPSQIASAINTTGGGVSWESGATLRPNLNMFSNNSSSQSITYSQMAALMSGLGNKLDNIKVNVLESDITKTQNKVKAYEANGRF